MTRVPLPNLQAARPAVVDRWRLPVGSLGWLILLQWVALAVCQLNVPLAETMRDAQTLGVRAVLAAQMGAVSLLACGWRWPTALLAALINLPLPILAAGIAAQSVVDAMVAATISGLLGLVLVGWSQVFTGNRAHRFLQCFSLLLTVGAVLLGYLAVEFEGNTSESPKAPVGLSWTPLWLGWYLADGDAMWVKPLLGLIAAGAIGWGWATFQAFQTRRQTAG